MCIVRYCLHRNNCLLVSYLFSSFNFTPLAGFIRASLLNSNGIWKEHRGFSIIFIDKPWQFGLDLEFFVKHHPMKHTFMKHLIKLPLFRCMWQNGSVVEYRRGHTWPPWRLDAGQYSSWDRGQKVGTRTDCAWLCFQVWIWIWKYKVWAHSL